MRKLTISDPLPDLLFRRCKLSQEETLRLADEIAAAALFGGQDAPAGVVGELPPLVDDLDGAIEYAIAQLCGRNDLSDDALRFLRGVLRKTLGHVTRCRKCGKVAGTGGSKYCGDGTDKDNEHAYEKVRRMLVAEPDNSRLTTEQRAAGGECERPPLPPKRLCSIQIKVGGDTWEAAKAMLDEVHGRLWEHYRGLGTNGSASFTAAIEHREGVTAEQYERERDEWLEVMRAHFPGFVIAERDENLPPPPIAPAAQE